MMHFRFAALCSCAALFSTAVFANGTLHNWSGFYAGVNAGAVGHTINMTDTQATSFNATIQQVTDPRFTGGLQVGYRKQFDLSQASGLYGAELAANFAHATSSRVYGSSTALYQLYSTNTLENVALLQAIAGIAADRTLLFLAAGLSWTNISGSTSDLNAIGFFNSFSMDNKALGVALGGGIEYAFCDKISARFKLDVITPTAYSSNDSLGNTFQMTNSIVQATIGINYQFA